MGVEGGYLVVAHFVASRQLGDQRGRAEPDEVLERRGRPKPGLGALQLVGDVVALDAGLLALGGEVVGRQSKGKAVAVLGGGFGEAVVGGRIIFGCKVADEDDIIRGKKTRRVLGIGERDGWTQHTLEKGGDGGRVTGAAVSREGAVTAVEANCGE